MPRKLLLSSLLLIAVAGSVAAREWIHESSDLAPDPTVHFGVLPNGMRYLIDENAEPPGRISLRIVFQAGSLMEEEGEEGLAHFLEHLAFNGTERFPKDEMIRYLQRLGMAFGPDTNANTGFDRTLYQLDLPDDDPEVLQTGLALLRDYAERLLLLPEEIEQERGIILAEKQSRDSVGYRTRRAENAFLLDGLTYPERWPIGTEEAIATIDREAFEQFYRTWYRPDRTILVVVGEVDPADVAAKIEAEFGDWEAATAPPEDPETGSLAVAEPVEAMVHNAAEAPHSDFVIYGVRPQEAAADTLAKRNRETLENLGHAILSNRFARITRLVESPIQVGYSWSTDYYKGAHVVAVGAYGEPSEWRSLVPVVEQELRRALDHGFTGSELAEARANLLNSAREAVQKAPTRDSRQLAGDYANAANQGIVIRSPEQELARIEALLEQTTVAVVEAAYRALWDNVVRKLWVTGAFGEASPQTDEVQAAVAASGETTVEPPEEEAMVAFPYPAAALPGEVVHREVVPDLAFEKVTFANGLVAFLKPTEFEKNAILMAVRIGSGLQDLPEEAVGLQRLAEASWIEAGLGKISRDDLNRALAGETVGVDFAVDETAFVLSGMTNPEDLGLQLRLATAYLKDPGYREEALARFRRSLPGMYQELATTWRGALDREVRPWLRGGDWRFEVLGQEALAGFDLGDLRGWIGFPLSDLDGLEIVLVGDFVIEEAIDALAGTLGAVEREPGKPVPAIWGKSPGYPEPGAVKSVVFESEVRQGLLTLAWPTGGQEPIDATRRRSLLANVVDDRVRVKIRETFGDTYSYGVYNNAGRSYDHGLFTIILQIDPDRIEAARAAISELIEDLLANGITEDEFVRAREPMLRQIETMQRENAYWLRTLGGASRRPVQIDWARTLESGFSTISREDLEAEAEAVFRGVAPFVAKVMNQSP